MGWLKDKDFKPSSTFNIRQYKFKEYKRNGIIYNRICNKKLKHF